MLESLFNPESIAIVGASRTPGKLGYAVLANVVESEFAGPIYLCRSAYAYRVGILDMNSKSVRNQKLV